MNIFCLVKFVPDSNEMAYDYEKNTLNRNNAKTIVNPDDASAIEIALRIKDNDPETYIEIVTMGPMNVLKFLEDYCRRGADKATLISDISFAGSDTLVTSRILSKYLQEQKVDLIFTGNKTIDGETGQVSAQVAEFLDVDQFSNVIEIENINKEEVICVVDYEDKTIKVKMKLPCLLSVEKEIVKRVRFTKYKNMKLDVGNKINIITNEDLKMKIDMIGLKGSPTKVKSTKINSYKKGNGEFLRDDDYAVERVYEFIKSKGFVKHG